MLAGVVLLSAASGTGTSGEDKHLGGDYPAFYAAGSIAADGDWSHLYEDETQQRAQEGLVDDSGGFLYFAYPPPVAGAYSLLARIEYRWSYVLHTVLMGLALWGAVRAAGRMIPAVGRQPFAAFAVALVSYPLFRAVTGGQNTALTLLLVVSAARYDRDSRPLPAGLMVGLLLYKPQFAAGLIVLLAIRKRWLSVAVSAVVGGTMWAFSAAVMGTDWLSVWWPRAAEFSSVDAAVNSSNLISLAGALGHVAGGAGEVIGWFLAALLAIALVWFWSRRRELDPALFYELAVAAAVLVLPRPLFYEAGLALFVAGLAAGPRTVRWVALGAVATWVQPVSGGAGSSLPLTLLVAAAVLWALAVSRRADRSRLATDAVIAAP